MQERPFASTPLGVSTHIMGGMPSPTLWFDQMTEHDLSELWYELAIESLERGLTYRQERLMQAIDWELKRRQAPWPRRCVCESCVERLGMAGVWLD